MKTAKIINFNKEKTQDVVDGECRRNGHQSPFESEDKRYVETMKLIEDLKIEMVHIRDYPGTIKDPSSQDQYAGVFQWRNQAVDTIEVSRLYDEFFEDGDSMINLPIGWLCPDGHIRYSHGNTRTAAVLQREAEGHDVGNHGDFILVHPELWCGTKLSEQEFLRLAGDCAALSNREDKLATRSTSKESQAIWLNANAPLHDIDLSTEEGKKLGDKLLQETFPKLVGDSKKRVRGAIISDARGRIGSQNGFSDTLKEAKDEEGREENRKELDALVKEFFPHMEWDTQKNDGKGESVLLQMCLSQIKDGQQLVLKSFSRSRAGNWDNRIETHLIIGHTKLAQAHIDRHHKHSIKWLKEWNIDSAPCMQSMPKPTRVIFAKMTNLDSEVTTAYQWEPSLRDYVKVEKS